MDRTEFSESDIRPDRLRIFRIVLTRLEIDTVWISGSRTRQGVLDHLARGRHNPRVESCNGDLVARVRDRMFALRHNLWIGLFKKVVGQLARLNVRAVIDKFPNRDLRSQF